MSAPRIVMRAWPLTTTLVAAMLLAGCSRSMSDLEEWVAEVKSRKSTQIAPIPTIKPYEAFAYDPTNRRDPFIAVDPVKPGEGKGGSGPQPDRARPPEVLEQFPLDALSMQGTIRTTKVVFALVRAPDRVVYRVSIGAHMGQNFGQIKSITDNQIKLSELIADGFGGWQQRDAELTLKESGESKQ